jgi:hypothetical protein
MELLQPRSSDNSIISDQMSEQHPWQSKKSTATSHLPIQAHPSVQQGTTDNDHTDDDNDNKHNYPISYEEPDLEMNLKHKRESNSDKTIDDSHDDDIPLAVLGSEISNNPQMSGEEVETTIQEEEEEEEEEEHRPSQTTVLHSVPDNPTHTHNNQLPPTSHQHRDTTTSFFRETSDGRKNTQQEVSSSILSRIHVAKDILKETKTSLKRLREKSIQVLFFSVKTY